MNGPPVTISFEAPSITVITCLFDLGKREGSDRQSIDFYLDHGRAVLGLDVNMIVFVDAELVEKIPPRDKLQVVAYAFEASPAYAQLDRIRAAREANPFHWRNEVKDTPVYAVFQRTKLELLALGAKINPFKSTHFAWIDFGIAKAVAIRNVMSALDEALKLEHVELCIHATPQKVLDWRELRQNLSAGYIVGPRDAIIAFANRALDAWELLLTVHKIAPHDETLYEHLLAESDARVTAIARGRMMTDHTRIFEDFAPLLGLVMIVKNEAHGIAATLRSFKPWIDRWTIFDTGSTDGTQDVIRAELAGVAGQLIEGDFGDFSTARNRALDEHASRIETTTLFTIMPDSDDILAEGAMLRSSVDAAKHLPCGALNLQIVNGQTTYYLPLVMRTDARWRYHGRVHETATGPKGEIASSQPNISGATLTKIVPELSVAASTARYTRDVKLLTQDLIDNPNNDRAMFYLAQTHACIGNFEEAAHFYVQRINAGGWFEERYEAALRLADVRWKSGQPWPVVLDAYLAAYELDPTRAEPLFKIAEHYRYGRQLDGNVIDTKDHHALTFLFASRAMQHREPTGKMLYVNHEAYAWRAADLTAISAYYLTDPVVRSIGAIAAERAVQGNPRDASVRQNRAWYAPTAKELFGVELKPIEAHTDPGYTASNPSIHYDGHKLRCIVRTTNYKIVDGNYITPDNNVIYTRNVMIELDSKLNITRSVPMLEPADLPRTSYPVHGFEDCRLFEHDGTLLASSTVCDLGELDAHGDAPREIALLALNRKTYAIENVQVLRGNWSTYHQKNWMPIEHGKHMRFVYATDPQASTIEFERSSIMVYGWKHVQGPEQIDNGVLRGGSQLVRLRKKDPKTHRLASDRYLAIVHDVTFRRAGDQWARTYLHRFVIFDSEINIIAMSPLFFFEKRGIEFCAGLALVDDRLIASYSVDDSKAMLATFDINAVLQRMSSNYVI